MAVTVPWSIPVGTVRMPAARQRSITASGSSRVAQSTSFTGRPSNVSRIAPPTQRILSAPNAALSACNPARLVHSAVFRSAPINQPVQFDPARKIGDDCRSHAPDVKPLIMQFEIFAHVSAPEHLLFLPILAPEQQGKWGFEPGLDLPWVGRQLDIGRNNRDNGSDVEAGAGLIAI